MYKVILLCLENIISQHFVVEIAYNLGVLIYQTALYFNVPGHQIGGEVVVVEGSADIIIVKIRTPI